MLLSRGQAANVIFVATKKEIPKLRQQKDMKATFFIRFLYLTLLFFIYELYIYWNQKYFVDIQEQE